MHSTLENKILTLKLKNSSCYLILRAELLQGKDPCLDLKLTRLNRFVATFLAILRFFSISMVSVTYSRKSSFGQNCYLNQFAQIFRHFFLPAINFCRFSISFDIYWFIVKIDFVLLLAETDLFQFLIKWA